MSESDVLCSVVWRVFPGRRVAMSCGPRDPVAIDDIWCYIYSDPLSGDSLMARPRPEERGTQTRVSVASRLRGDER